MNFCEWCGELHRNVGIFCSDECFDAAVAYDADRCFECDEELGACSCPPPRPIVAVKVKAGLL